jgi:hypothetical protein
MPYDLPSPELLGLPSFLLSSTFLDAAVVILEMQIANNNKHKHKAQFGVVAIRSGLFGSLCV